MGKKLLDDSDLEEESTLKINESYANNYNKWRRKEEYQKLKDRYGDVTKEQLDDMDSSSSEDTEDEAEQVWDSDMDKDFFVTLSCLKSKDPRIYDSSEKFFKSESKEKDKASSSKPKEKSEYLHDYERKLILKQEDQESDEDDVKPSMKQGPSYIEKLQKIKEGFSKAQVEEDDDDDDSLLLTQRTKTEKEKEKEEEEYIEWLKGNENELENSSLTKDLGFLKDLWGKPKKLDKNEKFLRDYILNKRYREKDNKDHIPDYEELIHDSDENLSEDERTIENQEHFEHKCNFRFEEPDPDFIKRYPRTIGSSVRKTDDRRKLKRQEVKERKEQEKVRKKQDLLQLKAMKRKELQEKLERLKEETGNDQLPFQDDDLDDDFDPEKHDQKMKEMFNDDFYAVDEGDQKPEFGEEDDLDIENWEAWQGERDEEEHEPHCEDADFNMDCEYDPREAAKQEILDATKGKRGRKKKRGSKFRESARRPKEAWDPEQQDIQEWLDEYYALDYEDMIGDLPCRFKYRQVEPNDFGLTTEEILFSKDKELNRWVSLKKMSQYRPDEEERKEKLLYQRKPQSLKKKVLTSYYEEGEPSTSAAALASSSSSRKRRRRKKKDKPEDDQESVDAEDSQPEQPQSHAEDSQPEQQQSHAEDSQQEQQSPDTTKVKRKKKKRKKQESFSVEDSAPNASCSENDAEQRSPPKKLKTEKHKETKKNKKHGFKEDSRRLNPLHMSESRLKLYGIKNPTRYKESIKYGKKNKEDKE